MTVTIDEAAARRSHDNMSFSDYRPGSATAEYLEICKEADARASKYPENEKAQQAAATYKAAMGAWINAHNARGSRHVSSFISGPANYNMRQHEKWLAAEGKGWEEYAAIKARFESAMHGAANPVIHSADADALEALQDKLSKALEEHASYIEYNKQARRDGTEALPAYVLQNSNGRIKALRDRIALVERMKATEPRRADFPGGHVVENTDAGRTQIIFDDKPEAEMREKLKAQAWKWAPSSGAWQRQLTQNAWYSARQILGIK